MRRSGDILEEDLGYQWMYQINYTGEMTSAPRGLPFAYTESAFLDECKGLFKYALSEFGGGFLTNRGYQWLIKQIFNLSWAVEIGVENSTGNPEYNIFAMAHKAECRFTQGLEYLHTLMNHCKICPGQNWPLATATSAFAGWMFNTAPTKENFLNIQWAGSNVD